MEGRKKVRESNLELLRILAMLLIILYHYCSYLDWAETQYTFNKVFYVLLGSWGALFVNIFIIISAWFLSESSAKFSIWKVLKIICETSFYSVAIYVVLCIMGDTVFVPKKFLQALLSPFLGTYWFITAYLAFYLLCPLLNILVQSLSQKQFRTFIGILTVIIPLFQMFVEGNPNWGIISMFVYLFILTAGLKQCEKSWLEQNAKIIMIGDFLFLVLMGYLCRKSGHVEYINFFLEKSSIFIILEAFSIFFVFKNWKIKHSKLINQAAASVFGVYILHQYRPALAVLWDKIFKTSEAYQSSFFVIYLLLTGIVILIVGIIVDMIRIKILEKPFFKLLERSVIGRLVKKCDDGMLS